MRYPMNDWSSWYIAQGYGAKTAYGYHDGDDLPPLKLGIFPLFISMYFYMARMTQRSKIAWTKVIMVLILMMNRKVFNTTKKNTSRFSLTQLTKLFSMLFIEVVAAFPITIFISRVTNKNSRFYRISSSYGGAILTKIRTILISSTSPHLVSWRSKLFSAIQASKNKLTSCSFYKVFLLFKYAVFHIPSISRSTREYL